jgi:hypothetical protein
VLKRDRFGEWVVEPVRYDELFKEPDPTPGQQPLVVPHAEPHGEEE